MPKQVDRLLATAKEAASAAARIHRDAAQHGGGRWIDEKTAHRIRVSGTERLDRYLVGTGFPFKAHELLAEYLRQFERVLRRTAGIRRTGAAAIDLAYVANGILEGFWESRLAPWDYAAGVLLVAEAGGVAERVEGGGMGVEAGSVLAANSAEGLRRLRGVTVSCCRNHRGQRHDGPFLRRPLAFFHVQGSRLNPMAERSKNGRSRSRASSGRWTCSSIRALCGQHESYASSNSRANSSTRDSA